MGSILTLEQIVNANDLPTKEIDVPAWGGTIVARMLTKGQQHQIRVAATVDGMLDEEKLELGLLVSAIVEPDLSMEHISMLREKNAEVVDEILEEVFSMNAIDKEAVARKRAEFQAGPDSVAGVPHSVEAGPDVEGDAPGVDH